MESDLTEEEVRIREREFVHHCMQAKFIDDQLSAAGHEMCAKAYESIQDLKLHGNVFVSPFRRTIQSACNLLKNHPNKAELTLVLKPGAAEHLGFKNVFLLHADALKRYCARMTEQYGLTIDTTFVDQYQDPKLWFLELITDEAVKSQLQQIARSHQRPAAGEDDYDLAVYEAMKEHFLNVMQNDREPENLEEFLSRVTAFKREVQEYGRQRVAADETILILTHSRLINVFLDTLTRDEETGKYRWGTHTEVAQTFRTVL